MDFELLPDLVLYKVFGFFFKFGRKESAETGVQKMAISVAGLRSRKSFWDLQSKNEKQLEIA